MEMGKITIDQSHAIMSILATNADWDSIDFITFDLQNGIMRNPKGAGRAFTQFLMNGARLTPQLPNMVSLAHERVSNGESHLIGLIYHDEFSPETLTFGNVWNVAVNRGWRPLSPDETYLIRSFFPDKLYKETNIRTIACMNEASRNEPLTGVPSAGYGGNDGFFIQKKLSERIGCPPRASLEKLAFAFSVPLLNQLAK